MGDERAAVEIDQQVLGAPTHVVNALADEFSDQRRLDWPAQARLAQIEGRHSVADDGFTHTATCRLDFG